MRRPNRKLFRIFAAAASLAALAAWAQQPPKNKPPNPDENTGTIFRSDIRLVVLNTTVSDKSGHLITDLPKSAFTVYENGVTQPIKSFKREDVPVSMGLIIDNSGSMRDKRAKVEAAALALVKDSNPDDEVFVVNFNDEAFLDNPHGKDFTNDVKEMEEALTRIDSRGGTAMRDAIRMSIDHLKEKAHKDKKVLVVVTDGNDNSSVMSLENLVKASQQSDVLIYGIGLLSEEERREAKRAERALNELAVATGGETFFPKDVSEVERIAHVVARDIRNQYTIQYSPVNQAMDGSFRQIKVAVNAPGRPIARTRSGYYATEKGVQQQSKSASLK
jgi:Ca-activated chloride channel family protein